MWNEPIIPTPTSFIKPDIVLEDGRKLTIMDVSVVAGNRLEETWRLKIEKYGSPQNTSAILKWATSPRTIHHLPVIISSRGLLYGPSGRGIRTMGLTIRDLMDICLLVVMGSLKCYDLYMRGT